MCTKTLVVTKRYPGKQLLLSLELLKVYMYRPKSPEVNPYSLQYAERSYLQPNAQDKWQPIRLAKKTFVKISCKNNFSALKYRKVFSTYAAAAVALTDVATASDGKRSAFRF